MLLLACFLLNHKEVSLARRHKKKKAAAHKVVAKVFSTLFLPLKTAQSSPLFYSSLLKKKSCKMSNAKFSIFQRKNLLSWLSWLVRAQNAKDSKHFSPPPPPSTLHLVTPPKIRSTENLHSQKKPGDNMAFQRRIFSQKETKDWPSTHLYPLLAFFLLQPSYLRITARLCEYQVPSGTRPSIVSNIRHFLSDSRTKDTCAVNPEMFSQRQSLHIPV